MYKSPIKFDEQIHQVVLPFEKSQGGDVDDGTRLRLTFAS